MAYQNFFATAKNARRVTPAQTSGKSVSGEFRMRNEGSSIQIVSFEGYETDKKDIIAAHIIVRDTEGNLVFEDTFECNK